MPAWGAIAAGGRVPTVPGERREKRAETKGKTGCRGKFVGRGTSLAGVVVVVVGGVDGLVGDEEIGGDGGGGGDGDGSRGGE